MTPMMGRAGEAAVVTMVKGRSGPIAPASLADVAGGIAQTQVMRDFIATWLGLRGTALMPGDGPFNPMRFGRTLAWISLLDVQDDTHLVYRIAARELEEALGYQLKGLNSLELLPREDRPIRVWRYAQVLGYPCGLYTRHSAKTRHGLVIHGEHLVLPLNTTRGGRGQVLACGVPLGEAEEVADWRGPDIGLAHSAQFVDIGAGAPSTTLPPG